MSKGDERAVGDTIGATAGIILGEDTTVQLLTASDLGGSREDKSRTSRLLLGCDSPSCECLRCSSRIKPMNKFLKTHLPIFTIVKKNHDKLMIIVIIINSRLDSSLKCGSLAKPTSSA